MHIIEFSYKDNFSISAGVPLSAGGDTEQQAEMCITSARSIEIAAEEVVVSVV